MKNFITIKYDIKIPSFIKIYNLAINLFGEQFVKNNKNKCKIEIKGKIMPLINEYIIHEFNEDELVIKLLGINNITNMSNMFYKCSSLIKIPDFHEFKTSKVNDMSYLFYDCRSLSSLPDISIWDTSNVKDMSKMFFLCESLTSLPDISKWDTSHATNMSSMFSFCSSLSSFPDISKWNINN